MSHKNVGDGVISCQATLDPDLAIGKVPERLFGALVEHMGRCVYGGLVEADGEHTQRYSVRQDVAALVRELGTTVVRYPGGNFVSGYNWEDGIGPIDKRPRRFDLAWQSIEPNAFGLHEFVSWCGQVGAEPMLAVNLGTRGVEQAAQLVEYANGRGGTELSDRRRRNGRADPFGLKLWCLGNEMDGAWQIGHKRAADYGALAEQAATAMRRVDPAIELVACGSSSRDMATFGQWENDVLERTYPVVDYLSLHGYFAKTDDDAIGYLASSDLMDEFIETVLATCDHVGAKLRQKKRIQLSFDEWNVETRYVGRDSAWTQAPRLAEDDFTWEDAVAVGGLLTSLLRHCDRVAIACFAQLVNVMAPIRAERGEPAWRQPTFFPLALTAQHAVGNSLRVEPKSDQIVISPTRGPVEPLSLAATWNPETGSVAVFAVNRSDSQQICLQLRFPRMRTLRIVEHQVISADSPTPNRGALDRLPPPPPDTPAAAAVEGSSSSAEMFLPPGSWNLVRLAVGGGARKSGQVCGDET
ncbi:MAG: alpha-L-arabinofuranosidase [Bifidobacteriaceae bacterium]|jgi:alpha-N-arabinofuranosidase|nr:alpha-L-arabinofuranosidase [Bifidobacteriaceae bacterium]